MGTAGQDVSACRVTVSGGRLLSQGFLGSVSSAGLEWLLPACSAFGMLLLSSTLVSSPRGWFALESTAVWEALALLSALLAGNVAAAPSGVPGVVVEEVAAAGAGAGAAEDGEVGAGVLEAAVLGAAAGADDAGAEEAGEEEAGAEEAGAEEAGAEEAGAEEAGAAGAGAVGVSARLQPATMNPAARTTVSAVRL
jgi:hypothetical protein